MPSEEQMLQVLNAARGARGLASLAASSELAAAAARHAADLARHPSLMHVGSDGSTIDSRLRDAGYAPLVWREVVGWGFDGDEAAMLDWWLHSPDHVGIVLAGDLTEAGVGYVRAPGTEWGHYWCVDFGRRAGQPTSQPPYSSYTPVVVGPGSPTAQPVADAIWEAATAEAVEWNPAFALHAAIVGDGYVPVAPERVLNRADRAYHYQRAMPPKATAPRRVYWCVAPYWGLIGVIEDGRPIDAIITPKPEMPAPVAPVPLTGLDMSEYLWGDGRVHVLAYNIGLRQGHQRLTTVERNGRFYQVKDSEYEELWADATAVYRGVDTSPGGGKYYIQRRDALTYGAAWCPRNWKVGAVYERNPLVSFYYKADCRKAAEPKEGYHRTWLRFAARHATWTSAGGVTLADVVELHWLTERLGRPAETYFYARRSGSQPGGLVGWRSSSGDASWIVPGGEGQEPPVMEVIGCLKG